MRFRLKVEKRGATLTNGRLQTDAFRAATLPDQPYSFVPTEGTAHAIGRLATAYNNQQMDDGYLDYLYSAEPIPDSEGVPA